MARHLLTVVFLSATAECQLPSSACDAFQATLADCPYVAQMPPSSETLPRAGARLVAKLVSSRDSDSVGQDGSTAFSNGFISVPHRPRHESFHWGHALFESFTFLAIEQAYVVKDDYRWVMIENGVPFNHYWRDYRQSLSTWTHSGWDDGDPGLYSYLGHPLQGALTGYIQIQNDPQGRGLEFSNTRAYWWSRFKALLWNAAYSTQWNIGPLSEMTVEKYGTKIRSPWNKDGTWPCTRKPCVTGVGQVDLVTTPVGGFIWIFGEDVLDRAIVRRVEGATRNKFVIDLTRCALNPIRGGANILHGKRPWYRASRDAAQLYFDKHAIAPTY